MHSCIFLMCLIVSVWAHPDVGLGYNYDSTQNGLPETGHLHVQQQQQQQQLPAENSITNFADSLTSYLPPIVGSTQATPDNLQQLDNSVSVSNDHSGSQSIQTSSQQTHQEDSYERAYHQSVNSHDYGGYAYVPQTTIHKHIYVHVPPKEFDDEDVITTRVHHQPAPKQKHYKIVFIKAPTGPSIRQPVVPPPPQNEEKTLIYVLHKRPELEQDIVIPTAPPTKPSKPEVYFIKYKTKKEEAPVYGPPPPPPPPSHPASPSSTQQQLVAEPRNVDEPTGEYGAPTVDSFLPESRIDATVSLTTDQPAIHDVPEPSQQPQQTFSSDLPSNTYGAPTMSAVIVPDEPQPTVATPNNQYLAPEAPQTMLPIVVEDTHAPSNTYGPPNRFFIKKKK